MPPEARREQLLDAALEVLAREGYSGVSIDAIAREAGVTRPVVYGVFDGLGALLYALLDRQEQRALAQLLAALPLDPDLEDPDAFVIATARRLIDTVASDPMTWRPILLAPGGTPPAVRERIARDREVVRERIRTLLVAGLKVRGGPAIDPGVAAHALIAIAEHFGRMIVEDPEHFEAEQLLATIAGLLAGLRP